MASKFKNVKAPDFTKHENVDEEYVVQQKALFKAQEGIDFDAFDKAYADSKKIDDDPIWVPLYMKVGLYCGMSPREFMDTPYPWIKAINRQIDMKLDNIDSPNGFISWMHIYVTLAIAKCFGGSK